MAFPLSPTPGQLYTTSKGTQYSWDNVQGVWFISGQTIVGLTGVQGPTGVQGQIGSTGVAGLGSTGVQGSAGAAGGSTGVMVVPMVSASSIAAGIKADICMPFNFQFTICRISDRSNVL